MKLLCSVLTQPSSGIHLHEFRTGKQGKRKHQHQAKQNYQSNSFYLHQGLVKEGGAFPQPSLIPIFVENFEITSFFAVVFKARCSFL